MAVQPAFTGRARRQRKTRFSVRAGEVISRTLITVGGIGTIVAVITVFVFLVWVVFPLFLGATVTPTATAVVAVKDKRPVRVEVDEYRIMGWLLYDDGTLQVFRLDNGEELERRNLFPGRKLTAQSFPNRGGEVAFGFVDGSVQIGRIGFATRFLTDANAPANARSITPGQIAAHEGGLISRTSEGQLRLQKIKVELDEPIVPKEPSPAILLIDMSIRPTGSVVSSFTAHGRLRTDAVSEREDLLKGEKIKELSGGEMTLPSPGGQVLPKHLLLSGVGDNVYVVWQNGHLTRISTQDIEAPKIVEEVELLGDPALSITAIQFLIGKGSMLVGDSSGRIRVWFRTKPSDATAPDGNRLVAGHEFTGSGAAVTSLVSSQRTRLMAAGYADGRAKVFYVTSEKQLADIDAGNGQEVRGLALTPKEDGLLAVTPKGIAQWNMDVRHPETTLTSIFRPVWYEGYEKPTQVWQSSGGSDEVEPKFGLWPLVFGTLKAAFYSLLIGVPLALLAAIYTSEFLHPRAKNIVKPTIELMASLPSVVLGFLAALVFAPFVEKHLSIALAGFFTIPGAFLVGAYVWQFLPDKVNLRLSRQRFVFFGLALLAGIGAATIVGPIMERTLFAGDLKGWLAGRHGSGTSGWLIILFPLFAVGTAIASGRVVTPYIRRMSIGWTRLRCAFVDVIKFAAGVALSLAGAWIGGLILNSLGFDPRGSVVGTYVQRNALVVGFVMGFAVIPIVYTLAEDALSAVPEHLRAASLGCGATPWQTASRVIVPSAMSGLFSAVMIGMGRAVGETMIVLMAAGNTPVMEMNIFNGFRTLSANIAVEMPEAVVNSTHYRTLFLAALLLFGFTFVVNTLAEGVRQRFRKRAYQL